MVLHHMTNVKKLAGAGLLGGLLHLVIAGGVYVYFFGGPLYGFERITDVGFTVNVWVGAILLGAIPAILFVHKQLVTPGLTVGAIAVAAFLWSSPGPESAQLAGASDFAFYFIFWFVPLAIAIIIGGAEYLLRTRIGGRYRSEPGAHT